jgi:hypothetical protein
MQLLHPHKHHLSFFIILLCLSIYKSVLRQKNVTLFWENFFEFFSKAALHDYGNGLVEVEENTETYSSVDEVRVKVELQKKTGASWITVKTRALS